MTRLCDLVQQVLSSNQEMSLRLRGLDDKTAETVIPAAPNVPEGLQRNQFSFAFEEDLLAARVYCRPLYDYSRDSLVTSAARTTASSVLSALSLTDISNISILAVPIYAHEISNSCRYHFGNFKVETPETQSQPPSPRSLATIPRREKWDEYSSAVRRNRREKISSSSTYTKQEAHVLGVPLNEIIRSANVATSLTNENGEVFV